MSEAIQGQSSNVGPWWRSFYDDLAMLVLREQSPRQLTEDVASITRCLQLSNNTSLLDQCCGLGQHAIEFSRRGHRVTGVDQATAYIAEAKRSAFDSGLDVRFEVADALVYVETPPVDAVVNWHSSFGYLPCDESNAAMLKCGWESLKPGGSMLLEYPNMVHLIKHFQATMTQTLPGEVELTRTSRIDLEAGALRQRWSYVKAFGREKQHESLLRIYLPDQLIQLMRGVGFESVKVLSHAGATLSLRDPRCVIVGRRPMHV